jgi:hypothetical protein
MTSPDGRAHDASMLVSPYVFSMNFRAAAKKGHARDSRQAKQAGSSWAVNPVADVRPVKEVKNPGDVVPLR